MAFTHGANTGGVYFSTQDLTSYAESWSVDLAGDVEEVTTFGSTGNSREFIKGLNGGSASVSGFYDAAADAALFDSIADATVDAFQIIPEAQAIGGRMFGGGGLSTSFNPSSSVGGVVSWSMDVTGDRFGGGRLLNTSTALTGTVNNASYDSGASSANGGIALFNFVTDDITSATVKIQDSANDSTWADLDSQSLTGVASYATVVTGTVDRYLRFACTAFSGTSAVVVASFIRFA